MTKHLLVFYLVIVLVYSWTETTNSNNNIPRFDRRFYTRYSLQDLRDTCIIDADLVGSQLTCIDCMKNISSVLLSESSNNAYIGAQSLLLSVDLDNCSAKTSLPWMGERSMNCDNNRWECANYLSQIIDLGDRNLVVCGTNYGNPEALRLLDMKMLEKYEVPRLCAQSPSWAASYLNVKSDNSMFVGVNENSQLSAITKFITNGNLLTSTGAVTTDVKWLDKAEFIGSFEHEDFAYFVMREKEEGVFRTSVGRVCKSDPGFIPYGQSKIDKLFSTFTKTYITCKMSVTNNNAEDVINFSVVTGATFNSETKTIYATFTQYLDIDIGGYALCSYDLDTIDTTFNGDYVHYNEPGERILTGHGYNLNCTDYRTPNEAYKMYITSTTVQQLTPYPLYYKLKKFTTLLADTVNRNTILYIGTDTGTVEKIIITPSNNVVLASEFVVAAPHVRINTLQFLPKSSKRQIVSSTATSVIKFPVERCQLNAELGQCIALRDPHCCWCKTSHSCSHINDCTKCVNDPETGQVKKAFSRLDTYKWEKRGECLPDCNEVERTCTYGKRTVHIYQVSPKISLLNKILENCTYSGKWEVFTPESNNVTDSDAGTEEAVFGMKDSTLYKILTAVFGSLFGFSMAIIVFLMCRRSKYGGNDKCEIKKTIDRSNSSNIISDKPISYMMNNKKTETQPMIPPTQVIMPQNLDTVSNSPYRGHMTAEDERLLQLREPSVDMTYPSLQQHHQPHQQQQHVPQHHLNNNNIFAQTLPRNFGNNPTLDRREPTPMSFMTIQRNHDRHLPLNDFNRYTPNMMP